MRVNVYIDGFNLYYGALKRQSYKWLDVHKFAQRLLSPDDTINRIWYVTANVKGDHEAARRQQEYLRALRTIECLRIEKGFFLLSTPMMAADDGSGPVRVRKSEEKGSDVNLATHLLLDAHNADFEAALVVSNDSDLQLPIKLVQLEYGFPVGVALPVLNKDGDGTPRRPSVQLREVAAFERVISDDPKWRGILNTSQFPGTVIGKNGGKIRKPNAWA